MDGSNNSSIYLTIGLIIVALLVGGSFYLYSSQSGSSDGEKLLTQAMLVRETESGKLAELEKRYNAERAVINDVEKQYSNVRNNILRKIDFLFKDPNGSNPKIIIKIKDKKTEADINSRRLQVTKLLKIWEERYRAIENNSPSVALLPSLPNMVKESKTDIVYIEDFINSLHDILGDLDSSTSGLSQSEINSYQTIVTNNSKEIEKVVSNIAIAETHSEQIYLPPTNPVTAVASSSTSGTSNPTTQNPTAVQTPVEYPPIVTPAQIQAQEEVVTQAQTQVTQIQTGGSNTNQNSGNTNSGYTTLPPYYMYGTPSEATSKYLPNPFADHTGWPDIIPNTSSGVPSLIDGGN